jgi:hypothetical protein
MRAIRAHGVPRYRWVVAAATLLAASAACGGPAPSGAPVSPAPPAGSAHGQINVALRTMPSGTATLSWDPNTKRITAAMNAFGFTPGAGHAMYIYPGGCAGQNQPPSARFSDIAADPSGDVSQRVLSQPAPGGIPAGAYLAIHLAPGGALGDSGQVSFTPIACAQIPPGTQPTGPVTLRLAPPAGHTPSGSAQLSYDGVRHTLHVAVRASGLTPNSTHAVHIHNGSCQAQGAVRYGLPDLRADAQGNAALSATVGNVTDAPPPGGWYINVHFGSSNQILTGNRPTPLFAPIMCGGVTG